MPLKRRVFLSLVALLVSLILAFVYRLITGNLNNDIYTPLCTAQAFLNGLDPYGEACTIIYNGAPMVKYPLTTLVAVLPFSFLGGWPGSLVLWSTFNALLVYSILSTGKPWLFLIFATGSYWEAFTVLQFSPLLASVALLPSLMPLALIKPNIGLPILLAYPSRRRLFLVALFLLITILLDSTWPLRWWNQTAPFDGFQPLLLLPFGPLCVLALLRWRDPKARFIFLMSAVP